MIRSVFLAALIVSAGNVSFAAKTDDEFHRYQVILDRMPFGEAPPQVAAPPKPAPAITKAKPNSGLHDLRLCALREVAGGRVRVGFVNIKEKPPKTYYLYEGEEQDGIEVVEVDYRNGMALLEKGNESLQLKMATAPIGTVQALAAAKTTRRAANVVASDSGESSSPTLPLVQRMKQRRIEEQRIRRERAEYKAQFTREELTKHFRQEQMYYIRNGMPLIPVSLTPEMDAQLVAEGYLDPL